MYYDRALHKVVNEDYSDRYDVDAYLCRDCCYVDPVINGHLDGSRDVSWRCLLGSACDALKERRRAFWERLGQRLKALPDRQRVPIDDIVPP